MPTITLSHKDLASLVGKPLPMDTLEQHIMWAKGEIEAVAGDMLTVDIKDSNRADLWSAEGVARELAGRLGKGGMPTYAAKRSPITIQIDPSVGDVRPRCAAAVVRHVNMTPEVLGQIIQLQEKMAMTLGRNRKEVAIGVYDLSRIEGPITYTTVTPEGISFVPLDGTEALTPKQIIATHQKGKEFGHLLAGAARYPIYIDAKNNVLSLPPIINSNTSGRVTEKTTDVFIECSGFHDRYLNAAVTILACALADRGGNIETVQLRYPRESILTPDLSPKKMDLSLDYVHHITGLSLTGEQAVALLHQARYEGLSRGQTIHVQFPPYRQDVMHQRDVVEDMLISYGYNTLEPLPVKMSTRASLLPQHTATEDILIGLGFQQVMSYTLTNKDYVFTRMLTHGDVVEIENPVSATWNVFRPWLLPSLLEFLSKNKHASYPQRVFEVGDCVTPDEHAQTRSRSFSKLAAAVSDVSAPYEHIASLLAATMRSHNISYTLSPSRHPSFLQGRVADIIVKGTVVGWVGEMHPQVLNNWGIEKPVAGFELDLAFLTR